MRGGRVLAEVSPITPEWRAVDLGHDLTDGFATCQVVLNSSRRVRTW